MTTYANTVNRLKSQWEAMLASGKMPLFEIRDNAGEYHIFDIDLYSTVRNQWYFVTCDNDGWMKRIRVDMYTDEMADYLERLYDACQKELNK